MAELTVLQSKFITEYLKHGVGSKAVIDSGGSPNGASVTANRYLRNPKIAAEIDRRRAKIEKKAELTVELVFSELTKLVRANVQSLFDEEGNLKPIHELPEDVAATISSIEMGDKGSGIKKLKQHNKLGAIELAAKLLGMIAAKESAQASVTITLAPHPELPAPVDNGKLLPEW